MGYVKKEEYKQEIKAINDILKALDACIEMICSTYLNKTKEQFNEDMINYLNKKFNNDNKSEE